MDTIKRIVIVGDVRRPCPQSDNIAFLYNLIKTQIKLVTGITPECICKNVYGRPSMEDWIKTERDIKMADEPFFLWGLFASELSSTLFIGFELPKMMKCQAKELGAKVIDVCVHPIRFMSDLVFGVSCNFDCVMDEFQVNDEQIAFESSMVAASCLRIDGVKAKDNSILLVGQTEFDRSVIDNGVLFTLAHFKDKIAELVKGHSTVLYKPHPNHDNTDGIIAMLGNAAIVRCGHVNIYKLFCDDSIKTVCGLSSSTLYEAKWFGKDVVQLMEKKWWEGISAISASSFMSLKFWRKVLGNVLEIKDDGKELVQYNYGSNFVRKVVRSWWGYDFLK